MIGLSHCEKPRAFGGRGRLRLRPRFSAAALKPGGRFYLSFKLGDHDGMRNGRWFTDMTEQPFRRSIDDVEGLTVDRVDITSDVRPGRADERWLNAWCMRI